MERESALEKLKELKGIDLHSLTKLLEVTVKTKAGKIKKSWSWHVCKTSNYKTG